MTGNRLVLHAALFAATASVVQAAPILHGDFVGTTVTYEQVTDTTSTLGDPDGMFGTPQIFGDTLEMDPTQFTATTTNGGIDQTSANLEFDVVAMAGKVINDLTITEAGSASLGGLGDSSTFASVTTDVIIDIEEVDFAPVPGGSINTSATMVFAPTGLFDLSGGGPLAGGPWTGVAFKDLDQVLADAGVSGVGATRVSVTITNTLVALSQTGTTSLITKTDADTVSITANIPEPTAAMLGLLTLMGAAARRS